MRIYKLGGGLLALLLTISTSANDQAKRGGGILHGTQLKMNGHTLAKAANRSENMHKTPLQRKIEATRLGIVSYEEAPLSGALKALREQIAKAGGPKVNFFLKATAEQRQQKISLDLENVPASVAIRYVAMASGMMYAYDEFAVVLEPAPPGYKY